MTTHSTLQLTFSRDVSLLHFIESYPSHYFLREAKGVYIVATRTTSVKSGNATEIPKLFHLRYHVYHH